MSDEQEETRKITAEVLAEHYTADDWAQVLDAVVSFELTLRFIANGVRDRMKRESNG